MTVNYHGPTPAPAPRPAPIFAATPFAAGMAYAAAAYGHPASRWRYGPWLIPLFLLFVFWVYRSPFVFTWLHGIIHTAGFWVDGTIHTLALVDKVAHGMDCICTSWAPSRCVFGADAVDVVSEAATFIGASVMTLPIALYSLVPSFRSFDKPFNSSRIVEDLYFVQSNASKKAYFDPDMIVMPITLDECEGHATYIYQYLTESALDQGTSNVLVPQVKELQDNIHDVRMNFSNFEKTFSSINFMQLLSREVFMAFTELAIEYDTRLAKEVATVVYVHAKTLLEQYEAISDTATGLLVSLGALERSLDQTKGTLTAEYTKKDAKHRELISSYLWAWFEIGDSKAIQDMNRNRIDLRKLQSIIIMIEKYTTETKKTFDILKADLIRLKNVMEQNQVDFKNGLASGEGVGALVRGQLVGDVGVDTSSVLWDIKILRALVENQDESHREFQKKVQVYLKAEKKYAQTLWDTRWKAVEDAMKLRR